MQEDCFHLGAKALIHNAQGELLILETNPKKYGTKIARFDLPGGRMQKNEMLEETLRREVAEELGITNLHILEPFLMVLSNFRISLKPSGDIGLVFATYLCTIPEDSPITLSDEHIGAEWMSPQKTLEALSHYPAPLLEKLSKRNS